MDDKKKKELAIRSPAAKYLTFVASIGESDASFEMRYEDENIWLTEETTIRKFRIVQTEGKRQVNREVAHYNLQLIIAVGFKVNNQRAVQFHKGAGQIVKDHTIQGWTMYVDDFEEDMDVFKDDVLSIEILPRSFSICKVENYSAVNLEAEFFSWWYFSRYFRCVGRTRDEYLCTFNV